MVVESENQTQKMVMASCNCGCETSIKIFKIPGEEDYYVSFGVDAYEVSKAPIIRTILNRLIRAVLILLGKDYQYFDIKITKQELNDFGNKLIKL